MKKFAMTFAALGMMAAFGVSSAVTAVAVVAERRSAVETVDQLEAEGHHVQINGSSNVPLSLCKATGVHGLNNSNIDSSGSRIDSDLFTTVYVDVVCQE